MPLLAHAAFQAGIDAHRFRNPRARFFYESYHWTTKVLPFGWIRTNIPAFSELKYLLYESKNIL
jgi:hypothetical protein